MNDVLCPLCPSPSVPTNPAPPPPPRPQPDFGGRVLVSESGYYRHEPMTGRLTTSP